MTDFVEMFRHWHAGRSQVQIYDALGIDRKTIRKYVAPAIAEGLVLTVSLDGYHGVAIRH